MSWLMACEGQKMKLDAYDVSRIQVENVINDWIFSRRDREILRLHYLDGLTYEQLADEVGLSVRQTKNIVHKHERVFFRELDKVSKNS